MEAFYGTSAIRRTNYAVIGLFCSAMCLRLDPLAVGFKQLT
jgi:hypothetical protein